MIALLSLLAAQIPESKVVRAPHLIDVVVLSKAPPPSLELLEGRYQEGDTITVTREGDGLRFNRGS